MFSGVRYRLMVYFSLSQYITREDDTRNLLKNNEVVGIPTIQDLHAWP